jgi:hypothetical protein
MTPQGITLNNHLIRLDALESVAPLAVHIFHLTLCLQLSMVSYGAQREMRAFVTLLDNKTGPSARSPYMKELERLLSRRIFFK